MPPRLFDTYFAVDWSSQCRPTSLKACKDAVWVGERDATGNVGERYFRTRAECREHLEARLSQHAREGRRVFLGFDFPYGYPEGFARSIGLTGAEPWKLVWEELGRLIVDEARNVNNRFEVAAHMNARCGGTEPGPFWGRPRTLSSSAVHTHSPSYPYSVPGGRSLSRLRRTEQREPGARSVWQLWGNGSVGGQALVGIPTVARLRFRPEFAEFSRVWPFETGFTPTPIRRVGTYILHAEIWPGVLPANALDRALIKDRAQVRALTAWLADLDQAGALGQLFDRPADLLPDDVAAIETEEGWFVGAGSSRRRAAAL